MKRFVFVILSLCFLLLGNLVFPQIQPLNKTETRMSTMLIKKFRDFKNNNALKKISAQDYKKRYSSQSFPVDHAGRMFLYLTVINNIDMISNTIISWGGIIQNKSNNSIYAWVPMDMLENLAALDGLTFLDTPGQPYVRTGSQTSAGYSQLLADSAISNFYTNGTDINGNKIKVGVISNGMQYYTNSQQSNDLPVDNFGWVNNNVDARNYLGSEGTAMMEIVYDIAPGAGLCFGPAGFYVNSNNDTIPSTPLDMANVINQLSTSAKCKVIVDDVGWPVNYPWFEDSDISQAIASFQSGGGIYVSAAGNDALNTYSGNPGVKLKGMKNWMLFNSIDSSLTFNLSNYKSCKIILQWDNAWGNSSDDYDLYLYDDSWHLINSSTSSQTGLGSHPQEWLEQQFSSLTASNYHIMIDYKNYYTGRVTRNLKVLVLPENPSGSGSFTFTSKSANGHIFGHAAAPNVISVAAYSASDKNIIEDFSSRGPSVMFPANNPGGEQTRNTPVITATDNVATRVGADGHFGNPFSGTSAAAPHVAAIAALYVSRFPTQTAAQFTSAITSSAKSVGGGTGGTYNNSSGYGKISAYDAMVNGMTIFSNPQVSGNTTWDLINVKENVTIGAGITVTVNAKNTAQIDGIVNFASASSRILVYGTLIITKNAVVNPASGIIVMPGGRLIGSNLLTVTVDQKDESNNSFGRVGRWVYSQFDTSNAVPYTFPSFSGTPERMESQQYFKPGTTQKFQFWNGSSAKIVNPDTFKTSINGNHNIISQFRTAANATIQSQLLETGTPGGTLNFQDPWLNDFTDSYGLRNQGMPAPFKPVAYSFNNLGTGTSHMGIFLGLQAIPGKSYYSVQAPLTQTNLNGYTGYFQNWSSTNATLQQAGPGVNGFDQKAVIFNGDGATVIANYKGHMISSISSATGNGSQRKITKDSNGNLHMVYTSANRIWYTSSSDGSNWSDEKPISGSGIASTPSIASSGGPITDDVFFVWQETINGRKYLYVKSLYVKTTPVSLDSDTSTVDLQPVVCVSSDENQVLVLYKKMYEGRYQLHYKYSNNGGGNFSSGGPVSTGTPVTFDYPSVAWNPQRGKFMISASGSYGSVSINLYGFDGTAWSSFGNVYSSSQVPLAQVYSQVAVDGAGRTHITWVAYDDYYDNNSASMHRSLSYSGLWSATSIFRDEMLYDPSIVYTSICGHNDSDGGVSLFYTSSGSSQTLFNMVSTNGTGWLGLNYISPNAPISYPLALEKSAPQAVNYIATKGSVLPYSLNCKVIDNTRLGSGYTLKTTAGNQENSIHQGSIKSYRRIELIDTTNISNNKKASRLVVQFGNITGKKLTFPKADTVNATDHISPFLKTDQFNLANNDSLSVEYMVKKDGWKGNASVIMELIDKTSGKVIQTVAEHKLNSTDSAIFIAKTGKVLNKLKDTGAYLSMRIDGINNDKLIANYLDVYVLGNGTPVTPNHQNRTEQADIVPAEYSLNQNYPNPFNPNTIIKYNIKDKALVSIKVFNMLGQEVADLVNEVKDPGYYEVSFDASKLASGVYLYSMQAGSFSQTKKMILTK